MRSEVPKKIDTEKPVEIVFKQLRWKKDCLPKLLTFISAASEE